MRQLGHTVLCWIGYHDWTLTADPDIPNQLHLTCQYCHKPHDGRL